MTDESPDHALANRIEAPEVSKSASLPIHPGAAAYYREIGLAP